MWSSLRVEQERGRLLLYFCLSTFWLRLLACCPSWSLHPFSLAAVYQIVAVRGVDFRIFSDDFVDLVFAIFVWSSVFLCVLRYGIRPGSIQPPSLSIYSRRGQRSPLLDSSLVSLEFLPNCQCCNSSCGLAPPSYFF